MVGGEQRKGDGREKCGVLGNRRRLLLFLMGGLAVMLHCHKGIMLYIGVLRFEPPTCRSKNVTAARIDYEESLPGMF